MIPSKEKGIELMYRSIPYANQIKDIDLSKDNSIYFTWRGTRFKIELQFCSVMTIDGCIAAGSNDAILMSQLLKNNLGSVL
jgi:hypothetical protein